MNWVDTAPLYGHGHADELVAEAVESWSGETPVVATKVGVHWQDEHAESLLTAEYIREDIERSLRRLRVDTIDLLQVHWPCQSNTPLEETCEALAEAQRTGKVRYIGLCNYNALTLQHAASLCDVSTLQTPYSALRREFDSEFVGQLPTAPGAAEAIAVLAYEPLCRGLLTGKFHPRTSFPDTDLRARDDRFKGSRYLRALAVVSRAQLLTRRWGAPLATIVLAWTLRRPAITAVIAGAKTVAQVQDNAAAMAFAEREDLDWDALDRVLSSLR